jgi:large subunit ribosomal protein L24
MARKIKTGDTVMVITGADRGKTGRVLRILTDKNRVVVEGINRVWKHVRPNQRNPQGGRIQKDAPIHISNILPLDPATGKGSRVKFEVREGAKHRVTRGGTDLGRLGAVATTK